jgi:hypothetical protein
MCKIASVRVIYSKKKVLNMRTDRKKGEAYWMNCSTWLGRIPSAAAMASRFVLTNLVRDSVPKGKKPSFIKCASRVIRKLTDMTGRVENLNSLTSFFRAVICVRNSFISVVVLEGDCMLLGTMERGCEVMYAIYRS